MPNAPCVLALIITDGSLLPFARPPSSCRLGSQYAPAGAGASLGSRPVQPSWGW
jgi:hypothetical protein